MITLFNCFLLLFLHLTGVSLCLRGLYSKKATDFPDDRKALSPFFKAFWQLEKHLKTGSDKLSIPTKEVLTGIHGWLVEGNQQFKDAFASISSLEDIYQSHSIQVQSLWAKRINAYSESAAKLVESLSPVLKKIPDLNIQNLTGFISQVKPSEKTILTACDSARDLHAAIKVDSEAFECQPDDLCSNLNES